MFRKLLRAFRRPSDPSGYFYYAKLNTPQGFLYKIGFTKKSTLVERFSFAGLGDEKLIAKQLFFTFREDAWDVEQDLLGHFDRHRAFGKFSNDPTQPLPRRGQSELFHHDVLGLDEDLYKLTDEEKEVLKTQGNELGSGCLMAVIALLLIPFTLGLSLFFLAGSLSSLFGVAKGPVVVRSRPRHPEKIRVLVDSLADASNSSFQRTASGAR